MANKVPKPLIEFKLIHHSTNGFKNKIVFITNINFPINKIFSIHIMYSGIFPA